MLGADCHHVDSVWSETRGNLLGGDALCPLVEMVFLTLFLCHFLHVGEKLIMGFLVFSVVDFRSLMHNLGQHFVCWLFHACQAIAI